MQIKCFVKTDFGFRPVMVEVVLVPGVSQIQILGLADQVIKESSKRILSALRHQNFRLPPGKQVLVNLHPIDLRKTGQGLDLAIALGILLESEQVQMEDFNFKEDYCYGSLTLKGEVECPEDLKLLNFENFNKRVLTGKNSNPWRFDTEGVKSLDSLKDRDYVEGNPDFFKCQSAFHGSDMVFSPSLARLMSLVALGEHPLLVAGHAGGGKTTLVENLVHLLDLPEDKTFLTAKKYWMLSGRDLKTRPVVQPHHSATPSSMIGGGRPLKFGEISLAHGGALILDELLEFHPVVQNALREPMEKGTIHLSRTGFRQIFPAESLVLATTNLCPCGNFKPGSTHHCRCSSLRLRNYVEKLTGPFLDRFAVFHIFDNEKDEAKIGLEEMRNNLEAARNFRRQSRQQEKVNQKLPVPELLNQLDKKVIDAMIPHSKSHRRRQSLLRVARTLADMEASERIKQHHLEEAQKWTSQDIYKLERFRMEDFGFR